MKKMEDDMDNRLKEELEKNASVDEDMPIENENSLPEKLKAMSKNELIGIIVEQYGKIVDCDGRVEELTNLCKRVQADFDNFRKRTLENQKRIRQDSVCEVIEGFLPTLDIIDQALCMIKDEQTANGIRMMRRQLVDVFATYGVSEIEALGLDFDPSRHEAVMSEEDKARAGTVIEVLRKGYIMGEKVLRYASVKVAS